MGWTGKTATIILLIVLVGLSSTAFAQERQAIEHVVLIGIDGFNPEWYLDESWPAPFLQSMARGGGYAERARPPFPSTTRPGQVTLITGWLPARHGVYNNSMPYRMEDGGSIYHAVKAAGGSTASVVWPGSAGAPIDHRLDNLRFIDFSEATFVPPTEDLISAATTEDGPGHSANYERYITGTLRDAQLVAAAVTYLERHRPTLVTVRFNDTDAIQHRFGRDGAAVRGIVASTDLGIREIVAAIERAGMADRTIVIVTGDHGMEDAQNVLRPNLWLASSGLGDSDGARFETFGGSAFLQGASPEQAQRILRMLETLPDSVRGSFEILPRERLDILGADPRAALALTARQSYIFHDVWEESEDGPRNPGTHGSLPTNDSPHNFTGFVAFGPGIPAGTVLDEIGLEDVAPTIAAFLRLDFPGRDGRSLIRDLVAGGPRE